MLQQQLQVANESIATKDAEINELKSRVAELEQLKNKQAQLIALKDTQLASAQKNLDSRPAAPAGTGTPWTTSRSRCLRHSGPRLVRLDPCLPVTVERADMR